MACLTIINSVAMYIQRYFLVRRPSVTILPFCVWQADIDSCVIVRSGPVSVLVVVRALQIKWRSPFILPSPCRGDWLLSTRWIQQRWARKLSQPISRPLIGLIRIPVRNIASPGRGFYFGDLLFRLFYQTWSIWSYHFFFLFAHF